MTTLSTLPTELTLRIISFLDADVRSITSLAQTSRQLREIIQDPCVWQFLCSIRRFDASMARFVEDILPTGSTATSPTLVGVSPARTLFHPTTPTPTSAKQQPSPPVQQTYHDNLTVPSPITVPVKPEEDTNMDWKSIFIDGWSAETELTRGKCCVRGENVYYGSMSSMQMYGGRIFGGFNNTVSIWDIQTGSQFHRLASHASQVTCLQVHRDRLVTASFDCTVRVWSIETGTEIACFKMTYPVRSLRVDSQTTVCGDALGHVYMLDVASRKKKLTVPNTYHRREVTHIQYDHRFILSISSDKVVQLFDIVSKKVVLVSSSIASFITSATLGRDVIAVGTWSGRWYAWDIRSISKMHSEDPIQAGSSLLISFRPVADSFHHLERINSIQILTPKLRISQERTLPHIVTCANDGFMRVWSSVENAYMPTIHMRHDVPVLCAELCIRDELDVVILSAAALDGRLHHWHIDMNEFQDNVEKIEQESDKKHVLAMDAEKLERAPLLQQDPHDDTSDMSSIEGSDVEDGVSKNPDKTLPDYVTKIGSQVTFASSFLPIMLYQEFLQLLTDRPHRQGNGNADNGAQNDDPEDGIQRQVDVEEQLSRMLRNTNMHHGRQ